METINKDIDIFQTLTSAQKAFAKIESGQLLKSTDGSYFVDRSWKAKKQWPNKYVVLNSKGEEEKDV